LASPDAGTSRSGHTRYSTTGGSTWENAQPTFRRPPGFTACLGHNGNLVNTAELRDPSWSAPRLRRLRGRSCSRQHHRHGPGHRAAGRAPRCLKVEQARPGGAAQAARRVLLRVHGRAHPVRRARRAGHPAAGARPARPRLGGRQRDGSARHRRRLVSCARSSPASSSPSTRNGPALPPASPRPSPRAACSSTSTSPGPTPPSPGAMCTPPGSRWAAARPRGPVEADLVIPVPESGTPAAIGYAQASGIPYGLGPGQERLCRAHLHPALADDPPARHPAQAQPAARGDPRQAAGGGRRLHRARQHPAGPRARCCARQARARCTSASPRRR
jgi:amidophosphoribosyltransferase